MSKQPRFVSIVDYPASGKSTYAQQLRDEGFTVISGDEAIEAIMKREQIGTMAECYATHKQEIDANMDRQLQDALSRNEDIAYDVMNTSIKRRARSLDTVKNFGGNYHCEAVVIYPPEAEEHAQRLVKRAFFENRASSGDGFYLARLEAEYQAPSIEEGYDEIRYIGKPPRVPMMVM